MSTQKTMTTGEVQKTALRLPKPLHEQILRTAEANGRSMNAEIVARLQESFTSPYEGSFHQKIEKKLAEIETKMSEHEARVSAYEGRVFPKLSQEFDEIEERLNALERRFQKNPGISQLPRPKGRGLRLHSDDPSS